MIPCCSEFRARALVRQIKSLGLSDECVGAGLRVAGSHACFILVMYQLFRMTLRLTTYNLLRIDYQQKEHVSIEITGNFTS